MPSLHNDFRINILFRESFSLSSRLMAFNPRCCKRAKELARAQTGKDDTERSRFLWLLPMPKGDEIKKGQISIFVVRALFVRGAKMTMKVAALFRALYSGKDMMIAQEIYDIFHPSNYGSCRARYFCPYLSSENNK